MFLAATFGAFGGDVILDPLERRLDGAMWQLAPAPTDLPVVLVVIDEASLAANPDPFVFWGPRFAAVIDELTEAGATVVGLDVLFLASGEDFFVRRGLGDHPVARFWDQSLRASLSRGRTVLPTYFTEQGLAHPLPTLAAVVPEPELFGYDTLGFRGGVVHDFVPMVDSGETVAFGVAVARAHGAEASFTPGAPTEIAWAGPPGRIPRLSFESVASGSWSPMERESVRGRAVLVGADHASSNDVGLAPAGLRLARIPLVEAHAQVTAMAIDGRRVRRPQPIARGALEVGLAGLASLSLLAPWRLAALGAVAIGWGLATVGAAMASTPLPILPAVVAVGVVTAGHGWMRFTAEREQRARIAALFGRFVSDEVAEWATSAPVHLGGDEREVTILFSDVRSFTTISERLPPQELVALLNGWLTAATRAVLAERGVVDKFIGDGVMAVFGAPIPRDDHPERAVRAAIAMAEAADAYRESTRDLLARYDLEPFAVGIGVATGKVIAGNIGAEERLEYTFVGDAVNVAARVEGLTKAAGAPILVTRSTWERLPGPMGQRFGPARSMPVKGRDVAVEVFSLSGGPS